MPINSITYKRTGTSYLYSDHALISMSSTRIVVKAVMNALAKRVLVISGMLRSMAARRML